MSSCLQVAKGIGMPDGSYVAMKLELGSLQSVRDFVANLKAFKSARPVTHLICNAAVYKPTDPEPAWTDDGFEMSMVRHEPRHEVIDTLYMFQIVDSNHMII
jgi:protochlorophyllide reductase